MDLVYLDIGGCGPGLVPAHEARIPVGDRGLLYGDGLFETMLLRDGQVPLLPLHLERMASSARALMIPFVPDRAGEAVHELTSGLHGGGAGEWAVRLTLTRGPMGSRGYQPPRETAPTILITATPYQRPAGPMSAITATMRRQEHSPLSHHKSTSALEKVLARAEAARAGCDEALLLNGAGRVTEGAATNLFIVRQGLWMTPPLDDGCLPGVMRKRVLAVSGGVEWKLMPEDLFRCEGVYLTNALLGCVPLAALDGRGLPWGNPPAFSQKLWTI